ncbi:YdeI/OmpD-associated family protein [Kribbella italica]|uniref:DUF1905 domain-containing protein n=1 Tax=Kribbella italica TaxID=1540520 RepID=A0A7W9J9J2_9ACTN|nr:YdeI/OmpD-associated family protein [Kribbella italica]MBB5837834.1 hypothetical protein [Kribbella italica]
MKFRTVLIGTTKVGFEVPPEIVESFGAGKKPAVRVTIGSHTYRSTVAVMGGVFMVGVSAENRAAAGVAGGDEVEITLELDTAPREVAVPADFAEALAANSTAKDFYETLSYSQRRWFVLGIEEAKKPETRRNRIEKAVERLASGRGQR